MRPLLITLLLSTTLLAQTKPTTAPFASLASGEIRYTPPPADEWGEVPLPNGEGRTAAYKHEDGHSIMTISANEQPSPIPTTPAVRHSFGTQITKAILADLEKSGAEIIQKPTLQRNDRFFIVIKDTFRLNDTTTQRQHLYRAMGYQLVQCTIGVDNQTPEATQALFATAQTVLDKATIGKRTVKPATRPAPKR